MSLIYVIAIIFLILLLAVSIYFNVKFGLIILRVQDVIESSLDIMDERYASISSILEIPIFYDSAEIRKVLSDIGEARNAVLHIASELTSIDAEQIEENEDTSDVDIT